MCVPSPRRWARPSDLLPRAFISGTGLIGTSIALGLAEAGWETLGWDPDPASHGIVDERAGYYPVTGLWRRLATRANPLQHAWSATAAAGLLTCERRIRSGIE